MIARLQVRGIADLLRKAHCSALLIRIGRGEVAEPGLTEMMCAELSRALMANNIELIGWHVPFCRDDRATAREIAQVTTWADRFRITGFIADAERTPPPDSPRFQGTAANAREYTTQLARAMGAKKVQIALSSHDQPNLHPELPFAEFLRPGQPAMPQVYNNDDQPQIRLKRSEVAYRPLLGADFLERFRPTANVSMVGAGSFKDTATCLRSLERFLDAVKAQGYRGHSLWCWDEMPKEAWNSLASRPVD